MTDIVIWAFEICPGIHLPTFRRQDDEQYWFPWNYTCTQIINDRSPLESRVPYDIERFPLSKEEVVALKRAGVREDQCVTWTALQELLGKYPDLQLRPFPPPSFCRWTKDIHCYSTAANSRPIQILPSAGSSATSALLALSDTRILRKRGRQEPEEAEREEEVKEIEDPQLQHAHASLKALRDESDHLLLELKETALLDRKKAADLHTEIQELRSATAILEKAMAEKEKQLKDIEIRQKAHTTRVAQIKSMKQDAVKGCKFIQQGLEMFQKTHRRLALMPPSPIL